MHKKTWADELKEQHDLEISEDADLMDEDKFDEEGPMAAFEEAADHAYDKDFQTADKAEADWFEDE
ncbi:MAG: hypothetical protein AABY01_01155 [Nanoarchaeota archaeon]